MKKMITAASLVVGLTGGLISSAGAQATYPDATPNPDQVDPGQLPQADPPAEVESAGLPGTTGIEVKGKQQLPVTGGDAVGLAVIGAVLTAGGGLLVWRSKGAEESV